MNDPARNFTAQQARSAMLATLPVSERLLHIRGIATPVLEGGSGTPLLLLHGPAGYALHWMRTIPALVGSFRVVAPDLPGHGASTIEGELDAERVLAWLGELIERTCEEPPILVGHLAGGAIAARFAARSGARLRALVLINTFGLQDFAPQPALGNALAEFVAQPNAHTHDGLWKFCAFDLATLRRAMGARWEPFAAYNVERAGTPAVQAALHALMQHFGATIPAEELARIRVPTSLVWGRNDLATPLAAAESASARYGWPLRVIENANDDPPVEQPEAVVRALLEAAGAARKSKQQATA